MPGWLFLFCILLALCSLSSVVIIQLQTVAKRVCVRIHNLLSVFNAFLVHLVYFMND